ncbi:hypothetical protein BVRB_7g166050 [Beta vulgaris subsp. vulgaris]|nr:hypothetical protein BVRB_7g166050 [Beta vulgaris subsp. vulgaris]
MLSFMYLVKFFATVAWQAEAKKRKKRSADKIAQTKKALAKAKREATKKAKSSDKAESALISLYSSDFKSWGSPEYTP